jgi:branched-chain amino acid transport system substrate-binding protein
MKRKTSLGLICLFLFAGMTIPEPSQAEEGIPIGVCAPLTGRAGMLGNHMKMGADLAAKIVNEKGVLGKKIKLIYQDDRNEPDVGIAGVDALVTKYNVFAVTGFYNSGVAYAALNSLRKYPDKPIILAIAAVTDQIDEEFGKYNWFFHQIAYASDVQKVVADFLNTLPDKPKIAIAADDGQYGQANAIQLKENLDRLKIPIVFNETFKAGAVDLSPLLSKAKSQKADIFYFQGYTGDGILATKQMKEINYMPKLFVSTATAVGLDSFLKAVGPAAAEAVISYSYFSFKSPYPAADKYPDLFPGTQKWVEIFKKECGVEPEPSSLWSYMGVATIAIGIMEAKALDKKKVMEAMGQLKIMTPMGEIHYRQEGKTLHKGFRSAIMEQWQKGQLQVVYPRDAATGKLIFPAPAWDKR